MIDLKSFTLAIACAVISLTACNNGDDEFVGPPILVTTQIQSDPGFDGDIEQVSPNLFTITQGMSPTVQSVFAGIDPAARTEFRAFLDFPLTGAGGVPGDAVIDSAFLDIYINSLQPNVGDIPILIDSCVLPTTDIDRHLFRPQPPAVSGISSSLPAALSGGRRYQYLH
jgi:hypothetical protein